MSNAERQPDERLSAYVDGCMTERERDRFVAELRVNPQLQQDLEEYQRTVDTVRRALSAPTVPVDLADRVMAKVEAQAFGPVAVVGSNRSYRLVVSVAAAAALLVLTVWLNSLPTNEAPSHEDIVQGESVFDPDASRDPDAGRRLDNLDKRLGKDDDRDGMARLSANAPTPIVVGAGADDRAKSEVAERLEELRAASEAQKVKPDPAPKLGQAALGENEARPADKKKLLRAGSVQTESTPPESVQEAGEGALFARTQTRQRRAAGAKPPVNVPVERSTGSDDFYLGAKERKNAKSKPGGKPEQDKPQPVKPDQNKPDQQLQSLVAPGSGTAIADLGDQPGGGAQPDSGADRELAGGEPPLAYLRVTRFVEPAKGRGSGSRKEQRQEGRSKPASPKTGGPGTTSSTLGTRRRAYGDGLVEFFASQWREAPVDEKPSEPATGAESVTPPIRSIRGRIAGPGGEQNLAKQIAGLGKLSFEDVTARFPRPLATIGGRAGAVPPSERCWLVSGSRTEVDALIQRLATLARGPDYAIDNGEVQLRRLAGYKDEAGAPKSPTRPAPQRQRGAGGLVGGGAEPVQIVLRFRSVVRSK